MPTYGIHTQRTDADGTAALPSLWLRATATAAAVDITIVSRYRCRYGTNKAISVRERLQSLAMRRAWLRSLSPLPLPLPPRRASGTLTHVSSLWNCPNGISFKLNGAIESKSCWRILPNGKALKLRQNRLPARLASLPESGKKKKEIFHKNNQYCFAARGESVRLRA